MRQSDLAEKEPKNYPSTRSSRPARAPCPHPRVPFSSPASRPRCRTPKEPESGWNGLEMEQRVTADDRGRERLEFVLSLSLSLLQPRRERRRRRRRRRRRGEKDESTVTSPLASRETPPPPSNPPSTRFCDEEKRERALVRGKNASCNSPRLARGQGEQKKGRRRAKGPRRRSRRRGLSGKIFFFRLFYFPPSHSRSSFFSFPPPRRFLLVIHSAPAGCCSHACRHERARERETAL